MFSKVLLSLCLVKVDYEDVFDNGGVNPLALNLGRRRS